MYAIIFVLVFLVTATSSQLTDECMACMCFVSSDGCVMPDPLCGPSGTCGPWAITYYYWWDGGLQMDDFETCAADWDCSESTVRAYLAKYVKDPEADCEIYSRTHFGGPSGATNDNSLEYWYLVKNCLDYGVFTPPPVL